RNADVIDLKGAYLLPGLWDVHIHPDYVAETGANVVDQTIAFGHRLTEALTEAGVVAVRCAGAAHFMDVAWKRAVATGPYGGPGRARRRGSSGWARGGSGPSPSTGPRPATSRDGDPRSKATARPPSSTRSGSRSRPASPTPSPP